jgi:glycosyltransferase involved in cell wall biosynthesis
MNETPLVSVIIPCYNQAHLLPFAIDSALRQTYPRVEVVVVNDGSTDGFSAVARRYGDAIKVVEQPNSGLSAARNAGIAAADGDFIVLLDSDDVLVPHCVASRMRLMLADEEVGVVTGYYREIDEAGNVLPRIPELRRLSSLPYVYQTLKRNWGPPVSWTIRRRAIELCGSFDPFLRSCEDWDLLIRISMRFKIAYDPEVGAYYRQLPTSMSRNHIVMYDAATMVFRKNAAYADSRLRYWWWSQFGKYGHGRRVLYNIVSSGPIRLRAKWLARIVVARPAMLWIGLLTAGSLAAGKRPSAKSPQRHPALEG